MSRRYDVTTPDGRREAGTELCRRLVQRVHEAVEDRRGVGLWPGTWDTVDPPSATFMVALSLWEASGTAEDREAVESAYTATVDAWRLAVEQYDALTGGRATA